MVDKLISYYDKMNSYLKNKLLSYIKWLWSIITSICFKIGLFIRNKFSFIFDKIRLLFSNIKYNKLVLRVFVYMLIAVICTGIYVFTPKIINMYKSDNNSLSFIEYDTHVYNVSISDTNSSNTTIEEVVPVKEEVVIDTSYRWPTDDGYYISTYFSRYHDGIDIAGCNYYSNVYSIYGGVVITSSYTYTNGNYIIILDDKGVYSMYAHLAERYVSEGQRVEKGTVIGGIGSTGRSTGPHLHFSTWYGYPYYGGVAFNPYTLY